MVNEGVRLEKDDVKYHTYRLSNSQLYTHMYCTVPKIDTSQPFKIKRTLQKQIVALRFH